MKDIATQAFTAFDLRLSECIEIGGWVSHSSAYKIVSFKNLPKVVLDSYCRNFLDSQGLKDHLNDVNDPEIKNESKDEHDKEKSSLNLFEQLQDSLT